jgi:hypothetical protein
MSTWVGTNINTEQVAAATVDLVIDEINHGEFGIARYPKQLIPPSCWTELGLRGPLYENVDLIQP